MALTHSTWTRTQASSQFRTPWTQRLCLEATTPYVHRHSTWHPTNPLSATLHLIQFTVVVEDKGFPVLASSATVVISVEDVNDQAPVFSQDTYR